MYPTGVILLYRRGEDVTETPCRGGRSRGPASSLVNHMVYSSLPRIPQVFVKPADGSSDDSPVVSLPFGKAVVHSNTVIKVHDGNEEK